MTGKTRTLLTRLVALAGAVFWSPVSVMAEVNRIDAADARKLVEKGEAVVVDVRSRAAWDQGHVPGALHIPVDEVTAQGADPAAWAGLPVEKQFTPQHFKDSDLVVGDVYVAPGAARVSARANGIGVREEIIRLVVHGTLHVLGHDHPEGAARTRSPMWRAQERLVSRLTRRAAR